MDNLTILKILNKNHRLNLLKKQKIFIGVFPRDRLPFLNKFPICFIFNTDPSFKTGEHWLAIFVDKSKNCYFFDSFGNSPKVFGLENYLSQFNSLKWNKNIIQGDSNNCGLYCILFLLYKSHNKLNQFYLEFNNKSKLNDEKLLSFLK